MKYIPLDLSLYGITDARIMNDMYQDSLSSIKGGVTVLQYRQKDAHWEVKMEEAGQLNSLCQKHQVPLTSMTVSSCCKVFPAAGIHIGQDDGDCRIIRATVGTDKIIGVSCHNIHEAIEAQKQGANYIGLEPWRLRHQNQYDPRSVWKP